MRSRFFRDTGGLDDEREAMPPGLVCVCLRMTREAYEQAVARAREKGITSGAYMEALIREREPPEEGEA